jgi:hypothetical protein
MTAPITAWLVLTLCLGLAGIIAIWSRRPTRARPLAVAWLITASPLAAVALAMALGWPVPYWPGVTIGQGEPQLLGHKLVEGVGIYVLLDVGPGAPRYYSMPWSTKTAEALQKAGEEAGDEGEHGMHVPALEWSWDESEPQFWSQPQPMMEPKAAQPTAPHFEEPV